MKDTTPEIEAMVRDRHRAMTPVERFLIGIWMFETARAIALASFPPGLSAQQTRRRLCRRFYGDLAKAAYPEQAEASAGNDNGRPRAAVVLGAERGAQCTSAL